MNESWVRLILCSSLGLLVNHVVLLSLLLIWWLVGILFCDERVRVLYFKTFRLIYHVLGGHILASTSTLTVSVLIMILLVRIRSLIALLRDPIGDLRIITVAPSLVKHLLALVLKLLLLLSHHQMLLRLLIIVEILMILVLLRLLSVLSEVSFVSTEYMGREWGSILILVE